LIGSGEVNPLLAVAATDHALDAASADRPERGTTIKEY
jgi:hypothetical protein